MHVSHSSVQDFVPWYLMQGMPVTGSSAPPPGWWPCDGFGWTFLYCLGACSWQACRRQEVFPSCATSVGHWDLSPVLCIAAGVSQEAAQRWVLGSWWLANLRAISTCPSSSPAPAPVHFQSFSRSISPKISLQGELVAVTVTMCYSLGFSPKSPFSLSWSS